MQKIWIRHSGGQALLLVAIALVVLFFLCHASATQATELRTAYQKSYPKYHISDSADKEQVEGLCVDIIRAIEKTAGITIRAPYGFLPFKRLQTQLAKGEIDIFVGMAKNEARLKKYIFINTPLYKVNQIIATRSDDPAEIFTLDDIRSLAPDNIILTNFGTATERLLKKQKELNVDSEGKNLRANLSKLIHKRGRFLSFHDIGLIAAIKRFGYEDTIKVLPYTLHSYHHYVAFAPDTPKDIILRIDHAVQELTHNGTLQEIKSRYVSLAFSE